LGVETIIGNYRIEEPIGRGGMGIVYRGHHVQLPREVAIKSIDARVGSDPLHLKARFEKEAYVQSQLDHPGIVKIYDYIAEENAYYIVMEFVEGRSLAQLMTRETSPLPRERALDFFEQMLEAISYAHTFVYRDQDGSSHRGLVHRDLKPANILITPQDSVKITDFGIVKLVGAEGTDTLGSYGSPEYVSPEQADGRTVDQRSDIYSLGIILYEMLTGSPPFWNKTGTLSHTDIVRMHIERAPQPPSERNPRITPALEAVVLRALEKGVEQRYASAADFLQAVRDARRHTEPGIGTQRAGAPTEQIEGTGSIGGDASTEPPSRESYVTQPIGATNCPACGVQSVPGDKNCRSCGQELNASPATVKLTRQEATELRKRKRLDILVAGILIAIALGVSAIFYARRNQTAPKSEAQPPATGESARPTPVPASALVELKPSRIGVDSSFDGYTTAPLTDGEMDVRRIGAMKYNKGNWASAETQMPHWIELSFDQPITLAAVYVYWGFDRNRFMPSRRVELQTANEGGEWQTVSVIEPGNDHDRMAFDFAPVKTSRARVFQSAKDGPTNRPFVMWVREVKVFGIAE
jgi:serine/threonine protein kinase